jgi:hypothetical protein
MDLQKEFERLSSILTKRKQDLVVAETRLQTLKEQESAALSEMKNLTGVDTVDQLESLISKEETDLIKSMAELKQLLDTV